MFHTLTNMTHIIAVQWTLIINRLHGLRAMTPNFNLCWGQQRCVQWFGLRRGLVHCCCKKRGGERLAGWTEGRWHLCPLSCPHNSLAVMKQGPTGIHTVSTYSRSQRVGWRQGGKGCLYSDEQYVNYLTSRCLSSLCLNLPLLLHSLLCPLPSLSSSSFSPSFFLL